MFTPRASNKLVYFLGVSQHRNHAGDLQSHRRRLQPIITLQGCDSTGDKERNVDCQEVVARCRLE